MLLGGLGWGRPAYRINTCLPGVVDRVSVPSVASIDHQWGSPLSPRYDSGRMAHARHWVSCAGSIWSHSFF
uniref:Secreted protein n=1 Tax=Strongyloides papillosus TaxID=174720 RepID=A0A0N5CCZ0_STREA